MFKIYKKNNFTVFGIQNNYNNNKMILCLKYFTKKYRNKRAKYIRLIKESASQPLSVSENRSY